MQDNYTPEQVISIYGAHDASVTFIDKNKNLRVYEYERFVKKRYALYSSMYDHRHDNGSNNEERSNFISLIKNNLYNPDIKLILYLELSSYDMHMLTRYFPNANFKLMNHHFSHAASGYFTSKFIKSLIFSVDGGGIDDAQIYTTRAYLGENEDIHTIPCTNFDFGNPYSGLGYLISEIKGGDHGIKDIHSLSNAGKIMGLCAYGEVRSEWITHFESYYDTNNLYQLCVDIDIPLCMNSVSGKTSYDIATTSQYVFEKNMDKLILPFIEKYNTNIVLVGGCALNVLYNQKLYERLKKLNLDIFIPSNPNDCGLSYGMFLTMFPEIGKTGEICYNGIEILDEDTFHNFLDTHDYEDMTISKIVTYLKQGKILGIINDNSEVGPRSLGNRSIICDPSFPEMKDVLNSKVKFREWFRPFAPVCRLQDKDLYFDHATESNYMSFAPKIKDSYEHRVRAIVHEDKTTRLQTTTEYTHKFFNDILNQLSIENHLPIILNKSFNIKGLPILTTYEDAFYVLDNTELDYLVIKDKIFKKKNNNA